MIEVWLIEFAKACGKVFLNPMLYWAFILVMLAGVVRIGRERKQFGFKVFDMFSEMRNMWLPGIMIGLIVSILIVGAGFVFPYEVIILLSIVVIIFSLHMKFTMLSASYTIGLTYLLILFSPFLLQYQTFVAEDLFVGTSFTALTVLLGLFLLVEAYLIKRTNRNDSFPQLVRSERGSWIGQLQLKKLAIIPFFVLVPSGLITPIAQFWPYFSIGEQSFSLVLIPFIIGFDLFVRGHLPSHLASRIANSISLLGFIVLLFAIGSIFVSWLSLVAVVIAVLGHEYIKYKYKVTDQQKSGYYTRINDGLKVIGIIPHTPGANLGILVGETITKVNGTPIHNVSEFYEALQASGAYFKLDVLDDAGEVRFVQSAFYAGDHYKLGLIFTDEPHNEKRVAE